MPRWDEAARQKQSELIRTWEPWTRSTGPKTLEGKAVSSKNRSPTDFFLLPGSGLIRADTKAGKTFVNQEETGFLLISPDSAVCKN